MRRYVVITVIRPILGIECTWPRFCRPLTFNCSVQGAALETAAGECEALRSQCGALLSMDPVPGGPETASHLLSANDGLCAALEVPRMPTELKPLGHITRFIQNPSQGIDYSSWPFVRCSRMHGQDSGVEKT